MKTKAFASIMLTLFLITSLFYAIPIVGQQPIKIGIMGPMGLIQGTGMMEGAVLAKDEIGTILGRPIELAYFDEFQGQADGTFETGQAAMEQLVAWGADFAIGGFRTESVLGAREVAMDAGIVYLTTGAATDNIIDCVTGTCGACVRCDRARYQYLFRITPTNSTTLVSGVTGIYYKLKFGFITYLLQRLAALYGSPVKYATVIENLVWTQGFAAILSNMSMVALGYPNVYPYNTLGLADLYLGSHGTPRLNPLLPAGHAQLATDPATGQPAVYLVSPTATDLSAELAGIKRSEARLIIQIISAENAGRAFTFALADSGCKAVACGINVIEQMSEAWDETTGAVEYQAFLQTTPTRPPITDSSLPTWDAYVAKWGHAPIYTAYGSYNGMEILAAAIERAGTIDPDADPVVNNPEGVPQGRLIREIEATDMEVAVGRFRFTGPNGIYHDLFSMSFGASWNDGYVRTFMIQWQSERQEMTWPMSEWPGSPGKYCKLFALPPLMYPYPTDVSEDGFVDTDDLVKVGLAYGSVPGGARWQRIADINNDNIVDGEDHTPVAADQGKYVELPLEYCNEAGHLVGP